MKNESLETVAGMNLDEISGLATQARDMLDRLKKSRDEQPARLAKARSEADEARGWSLIEEPWETLITAVPTYNSDGQRTGDSLALPSIVAKELFGARLAFDMLDAGLDAEDDPEKLEAVKNRYFTELKGEPGLLFLVCMAALDTVASLIVPQMVDELETQASNYDVRVMLAEARTKSWNGRVSQFDDLNDRATECGVNPVDSYDIAAAAMDGTTYDGDDPDQVPNA